MLYFVKAPDVNNVHSLQRQVH